MLRNWKKTASQQDYHKDVGLVWHSWKRWEKSCEGYHLKLNSKETGKKNPTMSATTEEMRRWKSRPKSLRTTRLKQTKKSNGLCFDRRKGDPKAIKRTHWNRQENNDLCSCFERSLRTNRLAQIEDDEKKHWTVSAWNWIRNIMLNQTWNLMLTMTNLRDHELAEWSAQQSFMFCSFNRQTHWNWQSHSFKRHR